MKTTLVSGPDSNCVTKTMEAIVDINSLLFPGDSGSDSSPLSSSLKSVTCDAASSVALAEFATQKAAEDAAKQMDGERHCLSQTQNMI